MDVRVNVWAVLLAMLSSMVVGSVWYSPKVFGSRWMKLARIDTTINRGSVLKPVAITVVISLITAYVLAHMAYIANQFFQNSFLYDSVMTALWLWLGFTAARFVTHDAFEGRPVQLTLINVSLELVTFVLMGLVIGLMGV